MSVSALCTKLEVAKSEGRLPKIVSVVHFAGQSADMKAISTLAKDYGFAVVEDASHAIGGSYAGQPVGNCAYSDICVFSFHPVKIVTTAEGGAATTQNTDLAARLELYRSHGVTRRNDLMHTLDPDPWYYEQITLGYNYRMTDIHAALGITQMDRLVSYVDRRHEIFDIYNATLAELPLVLPYQAPNQRSALHLYPVQIKNSDRRVVFDVLREAGLGVNVHYIPVHLQPYYRELGFKQGDYPQTEAYYSRAISLPMFPTMTSNDIHHVVNAVSKAIGAA